MIAYLDTSAVMPILIVEASTDMCRDLWQGADRIVSSRLTFVETAAALAMAERRGRISTQELDASWANFLRIWPDVDVVEVTADLAVTAAGLAASLALRGYDAVHCASAAQLRDPELVAVAGDVGLLDAWRSLGVAVVDTHQVE